MATAAAPAPALPARHPRPGPAGPGRRCASGWRPSGPRCGGTGGPRAGVPPPGSGAWQGPRTGRGLISGLHVIDLAHVDARAVLDVRARLADLDRLAVV